MSRSLATLLTLSAALVLPLSGPARADTSAPDAAEAVPLTAAGPEGALSGTLIPPADGQPVLLIIPGSGPTDRDGNNPYFGKGASYRLLAEALGARGIGTLRIDKRGMFASKAAVADANAVTIGDYVADTQAWVAAAREATGRDCVWLLGHSEGGLVALAAAQELPDLCGLVLVAAPGRALGEVLREQLRANPANAPILDQALAAIAALEAGQTVDVAQMHPALLSLFAPPVQPFLIDMMGYDPAALAAATQSPLLIVQGGRDLQVTPADAAALKAAQPEAQALDLPAMNHALKDVAGDSRAENLAAYGDPDIPVAPALVDGIAAFLAAPPVDEP